jgi:hypothetical protein
MIEIASALVVFMLLCASSAAGLYIQRRLRDEHRSQATVQLLQLVIGMLVTFAALVLGLLTNSASITHGQANQDRARYAMQLTQLDLCLRNYGRETEAIRQDLRSYTAAVIASTWPGESAPTGVKYPNTGRMPRTGEDPTLAEMMNKIGVGIHGLNQADGFHARLAEDCLSDYRTVLRARAAVIEDTQRTIPIPFYGILVFWLMIVFASFGLCSPRNGLVLIAIIMSAVSLSSVFFVIFDLFRPYRGVFGISSHTMRDALAHMMEASKAL